MAEGRLTYFLADTHLGLDVADPEGRERRLVDFLRGLEAERTAAVYLLGDIFDFWYEYRDVVPKGFTRVFAALQDLMEAGVEVVFCEGNHDIWAYHYFEDMGMKIIKQPAVVEIGGKTFCIGHGDGLGPGRRGYKFLRWVFHNRVLQFLFSLLHPWIAFRLGKNWSAAGPHAGREPYVFKGTDEPLYKFAVAEAARYEAATGRRIDYFVFGHFHVHVDMVLPEADGSQAGPRLLVVKDWLDSSERIVFDGTDCRFEG